MPDDDSPDETGEPEQPHAPFAAEDYVYQAFVSEFRGLQRAGADPLSAALITAAHLVYLGLANAGAGQEGTPDG